MSDMCITAVEPTGLEDIISDAFSTMPSARVRIYWRDGDSVQVRPLFVDSVYRELVARTRASQLAADSLIARIQQREWQRLDSLRRSVSELERRLSAQQQLNLASELVLAPPMAAVFVGQHAIAGVEFTELDPQLAEYFQGATSGLLVLRVAPGSPGARPGSGPETWSSRPTTTRSTGSATCVPRSPTLAGAGDAVDRAARQGAAPGLPVRGLNRPDRARRVGWRLPPFDGDPRGRAWPGASRGGGWLAGAARADGGPWQRRGRPAADGRGEDGPTGDPPRPLPFLADHRRVGRLTT